MRRELSYAYQLGIKVNTYCQLYKCLKSYSPLANISPLQSNDLFSKNLGPKHVFTSKYNI